MQGDGAAAAAAAASNDTLTLLPGEPDEIDNVDAWDPDDEWDDPLAINSAIGAANSEFLSTEAAASDTIDELADLASDAAADNCGAVDVSVAIFVVECDRDGRFEITVWETGTINAYTEEYECVNVPSAMTLTATPTTVESHPAMGNVSHSLIVATVTDTDGHYVAEGYEVDWSSTDCIIEARDEGEYEASAGDKALFAAFKSSVTATGAAINDHASGGSHSSDKSSDVFLHGTTLESRAAAILHCEGADPGTVTVTAEIEDGQSLGPISMGPSKDITATVDVTVVGPAAFISMVAEPTELVCGEKSQILVTVTDAIGQNVSDHTRVELITNYGGVVGGTGSSLGFPGINPVNPLSSSAAETFGGVASAFLLTSTNHIGAYEVVAAAGGSNLGAYTITYTWDGEDGTYNGNTGVFSTPVVTSQVTVTCTEAAPSEVVAPDTGTGTISPPNTGDAGLATSSAGTATLFVIFGAAAFILAGFASFGFARR